MKPEGAYQVLASVTRLDVERREIILLEIGQPYYATFENISEAGSSLSHSFLAGIVNAGDV